MSPAPEVIFVHGAGDTAVVWQEVQQFLRAPSLAIDIPGRGSHPSDLTKVTLEMAVAMAVADIVQAVRGPFVLVAHSIGGALSPGIARDLASQVVQLVHISAVAARDGELPLAEAAPEFVRLLTADADRLRAQLSGCTYTPSGVEPPPPHLHPIADQLEVTRIDSLNLGCVPTSWAGVDPELPRTYVQPTRDRLYREDAQKRLAAAFHADDVVTIQAGHNPARSSAAPLAAILDQIAARTFA